MRKWGKYEKQIEKENIDLSFFDKYSLTNDNVDSIMGLESIREVHILWDHSKSLLLTAWWMRIALVLWCVLAVVMPVLYIKQRISLDLLLLFVVLFVPVLLAFYGLHKMLHNIQQSVIFSSENTSSLRLVSWACFFAAVFLLAAAVKWPVLIVASGVIGFLGLFVRVIKNMLSEAIVLKEENDYTI